MKTSDYVTVGFIAVFVTVIAYFLVNSLLGDPSEASVRFEYLDGVSKVLVEPDSEIFNAGAINPTVEVYIGSCEDKNLDGKLDDDERRDCGLDTLEADKSDSADYLEANNGLSNDENEEINSSEDYAKGTTADQRQAVEDDVNQYKQQQQEQNEATQQESAADAAARRETVSGS